MHISVAKSIFAKMLAVLFKVALLTLVLSVGAYLGQVTFKPQVITEYEVQTKLVEKEVYIPVEKVIVKSIEISRPLRHFQDLDELEQWLGNEVSKITLEVVDDETDERIITFDCDDYAIELQEGALRDGYLMSFEVIRPVEYNALFKQHQLPKDAIHAINSVIIGNEIYYAEPQNHEIVLVAYLD